VTEQTFNVLGEIPLQHTKTNCYFFSAFSISLLLHLAFFYLLLSKQSTAPKKVEEKIFAVEMVNAIPKQSPPHSSKIPLKNIKQLEQMPLTLSERQIVTTPDAGLNQTPKKPTRFLSDTDSAAEKEQIRRGDGLDAGSELKNAPFGNYSVKGSSKATTKQRLTNVKGSSKAANKQRLTNVKGSSKATNKQSQTSTGSTHPSKGSSKIVGTAKNISASGGASGKGAIFSDNHLATSSQSQTLDLSPDYALLSELGHGKQYDTSEPLQVADPAPFSRSSGSGARFIGINGSSDYIPGISDGDITLLNAKADKFATFVRRVATQVFYRLKQQSWSALSAADIRAAKGSAVFRAKLSPTGELKDVEFLQKSESRNFDEAVLQAIHSSARDPHPPAEAVAKDGYINFIFMAKVWVRMGTSRTGAPAENRWLLLKTGLE
jgi:TonB family protein